MNSFVLMWLMGAGTLLTGWILWELVNGVRDARKNPIDRVALDRFEKDMKLKKIRKARLERENGLDTGQ